MPEDDELEDVINGALAFISGAAIGYALSKMFSKGEEHYQCPRCFRYFKGKLPRCPHCHAKLRW